LVTWIFRTGSASSKNPDPDPDQHLSKKLDPYLKVDSNENEVGQWQWLGISYGTVAIDGYLSFEHAAFV
jgi:hypothetical protein